MDYGDKVVCKGHGAKGVQTEILAEICPAGRKC